MKLSNSEEYAARHFGRFLPRKTPLSPSEVGALFFFFFSAFCAALNLAVIDTVMGHENAHTDCHFDKLLRVAVPSQLRVSLHVRRPPRRFKNATLQHTTARTRRRTTHIHTNITNRHTNAARHSKNKTCASRSTEDGGDSVVRGALVQNARLTCRAGHGFREVGTAPASDVPA